MRLQCNDHGNNGGIGASYGFAQAANETVEDAAIRAAQKVIATGINELHHYRGTNHCAAANAAFAFDADLLARLKEDNESYQGGVAAAAKLIEEYQVQHRLNQHYGAEGDARHKRMHRIAKLVPARKVA